MAEPIDFFVDGFHIDVLPFGCILTLHQSRAPVQGDPETQLLASDHVATVRMTPEFLKGMAFLLRNQVIIHERTSGRRIDLPADMMTRLLTGTDRQNWDRCWEYS